MRAPVAVTGFFEFIMLQEDRIFWTTVAIFFLACGAPLRFRAFLILDLAVQLGSVAQPRDRVLFMTEVIEFIEVSAQQLSHTLLLVAVKSARALA